MTSRWLPWVLALVAFVVTLAIENWPSRSEAPAAVAHASTPTAAWQSHLAAASSSGNATSSSDAGARPSGLHLAVAAQADEPADQTPTEQGDPPPAPPEPSEERAPALIQLTPPTAGSPQIATFQNLGPGRPTFTISTMDASGAIHSTIQVTAPPHRREVLNDKGLVILPGDRIVVQSPPYQELSIDAY